jgi:hypothetical protein
MHAITKLLGFRRAEDDTLTPITLSEEEAIASVARKFEACGDTFILEDHEGYVRPDSLLDFWQAGIRAQGMERAAKVKFVLIDLAFWRANPMLAGLVRRILATEDGLVHSALQVGPHVLHWFDGSLVHTKELHSADALLALDLGELNLTEPGDVQALHKLAEVVVTWNVTMHYNPIRCTCQHFVVSAIKALGMRKPTGGEIGVFLGKLQRGEVKGPTFKKVEFTSHEELDRFCTENLHQLDENDRALLKSFDRAFWLRHIHQQRTNDPSLWKISMEKLLPGNCVFGDPSQTGSFPVQASAALRAFPVPAGSKELRSQPPIRLLCLDGGGMRGVILIEMIRHIEHITKKKVDQLFDLVAGTSTGGILGAALATKKVDADGAERMYRTLGSRVFGYRFGDYTRGTIRTLRKEGFYKGKRLKKIVEEFVGEDELRSLHSLPTKVFVVAAQRCKGRLVPYIFRSYESGEQEGSASYTGTTNGRGITLAQALLATSAAPGYLPPIRIGEHEFVDGGMVANNPMEIAILEALRLWPGRRLSVVSLGTGFPTMDPQLPKGGAGFTWSSASISPLPAIPKSAEPLFDIIAAATDADQIYRRTMAWIAHNRKLASCVRLNPPCPAFDLATCKEEELDRMLVETRAYLAGEEGGTLLQEASNGLLNKD